MKKNSFDIYHDVVIQAKIAKVFTAVSDPAHLVNWWPQTCAGDQKLGSIYRLFFSKEYDWLAEVVRYEPNKAFHMSMLKSDKDWASTSFGYDLEEKEGSTIVQFWHKGWPEFNHHHRKSAWFWALLHKGLKDYVEKGIIVPFENRS